MKKKFNNSIIAAALCVFAFASCKKEEQTVSPPIPGNEFITTIKIRFENVEIASDTLWSVWKDLTPEDTQAPDTSMAIINLKKNAVYHATVHFYDETKSPAEELTPEIQQRANYHSYWFFKTGAIADHVTITATDHDSNNPPLPLGLANDFATDGTVSSGRLEGVLRHQPNSKNGTFTPGSSDSDVFFTLHIIP